VTTPGQHPQHDLDELLTNGVRLSIVAALYGVEKAEFGFIRNLVEISNPALPKQAATLGAAGYREVGRSRKGNVGWPFTNLVTAHRPRSETLSRHRSALRHIATIATPHAWQTRGRHPTSARHRLLGEVLPDGQS